MLEDIDPDKAREIWYDSIYICGDHRTCDWMARIMRDNEQSPWYLEYRFRYYKDDKVFDSEDIKNWYHMEPADQTNALEQMRKACRELAEGPIAMQFGNKPEIIELQCRADDPKMMAAFEGSRFIHMKVVPLSEMKGSTDG